MRLLRRAEWISLLLAPIFLGIALLVSSRWDALVLTTKGYCVMMHLDPSTGRMEEISKWEYAAFTVSVLGTFVAPPTLWFTVLVAKWKPWEVRLGGRKALGG
jgi:hypothetical protein